MKKLSLLLLLSIISFSEVSAQTEYIDYRSTTNPLYWKNRKPFADYWQQDVHYKIKATLNDTTDIISGSMEKVKLEYPNIKYSVHFTRTTLAGEINYVIWILIHLTGDDSDKLYNRIAIGRNPIS